MPTKENFQKLLNSQYMQLYNAGDEGIVAELPLFLPVVVRYYPATLENICLLVTDGLLWDLAYSLEIEKVSFINLIEFS